MQISGLHLLLTYQCSLECDHCFVWSSPWQTGTMTAAEVDHLLDEAQNYGAIDSIYFEGGEVFLFYPLLLHGVREAKARGFEVGLVTNCYWATSHEDAIAWLAPFRGLLSDFSVSYDCYHWPEQYGPLVKNALTAAEELNIPSGTITIAEPETADAAEAVGQLPAGESAVMYRGRAVQKLVPRAAKRPWREMDSCPYEDLIDPGRVHVDPLGYVHICQGIAIGNLYQQRLDEIVDNYDPQAHPICGPLLDGGPAALVQRYELPLAGEYADACHLCDSARRALRARFPEILAPDQMYGVVG
jgi:MoaA/NifB/PqqE/SkfB family radical SAM enzyme